MPCFIFIMSLLHFFSMAEKCAEFCPSRGVEQFTAPYSTPLDGQNPAHCPSHVDKSRFVPDFVHPVGETVNVTVKSLVKKKYTLELPGARCVRELQAPVLFCDIRYRRSRSRYKVLCPALQHMRQSNFQARTRAQRLAPVVPEKPRLQALV